MPDVLQESPSDAGVREIIESQIVFEIQINPGGVRDPEAGLRAHFEQGPGVEAVAHIRGIVLETAVPLLERRIDSCPGRSCPRRQY